MRGLKEFRVDRANGNLLGVCAGIARQTGWDVTLVRVAMVLIIIAGPTPWMLLAYGLAGLAGRRAGPATEAMAVSRPLPRATEEVRDEERLIAMRAAEVERCMASADSSLAREIEQLRQS